jgi:hypothetical protein
LLNTLRSAIICEAPRCTAASGITSGPVKIAALTLNRAAAAAAAAAAADTGVLRTIKEPSRAAGPGPQVPVLFERLRARDKQLELRVLFAIVLARESL